MHRFYVARAVLSSEPLTLPPEVSHQVCRVLRLRPGDEIAVFCGDDGVEHRLRLLSVSAAAVTAEITGAASPDREPTPPFWVAVGLLKGEKLDWVVQKLTELGAARVLLMSTRRAVVTAEGERWPRRLERYRRIAREAAEQCGRVYVPEVSGPRSLPELLDEVAGQRVLVLDPEAAAALRGLALAPERSVALLVGPEGGFTPEEVALARERGADAVSLGPRTLRAETAAIAAAALIGAR